MLHKLWHWFTVHTSYVSPEFAGDSLPLRTSYMLHKLCHSSQSRRLRSCLYFGAIMLSSGWRRNTITIISMWFPIMTDSLHGMSYACCTLSEENSSVWINWSFSCYTDMYTYTFLTVAQGNMQRQVLQLHDVTLGDTPGQVLACRCITQQHIFSMLHTGNHFHTKFQPQGYSYHQLVWDHKIIGTLH